MPREYIVRLVLDRKHHSLVVEVCLSLTFFKNLLKVLLKGSVKTQRVVGAITYRPNHAQGFSEIAFCAISSTEQVVLFY